MDHAWRWWPPAGFALGVVDRQRIARIEQAPGHLAKTNEADNLIGHIFAPGRPAESAGTSFLLFGAFSVNVQIVS
jgi:hypothetical protein